MTLYDAFISHEQSIGNIVKVPEIVGKVSEIVVTFSVPSPSRCPLLTFTKNFQDVLTQIAGHPGHSLPTTTEEGTLHKVFVRDIPGPGQGYPDVCVPDVAGISCPNTLFRKILVSVIVSARNSGARNGCADFTGAWKNASLQEKPCP